MVVSALEPEQEAIPEIVRLVVDAVPKYPVPLTVSAVEEAYGSVLAKPSPRIVVVAVRPTYKMSYTDARVVEAPAENCWSADHVLALAVLRVIEGATEPTTEKVEQEMPEVQEADEVATDCSAPVPVPYIN